MSLDQLLPVLIYVIVAAHSDQHNGQQQQQGGGRLELIPLGEWTRLAAACLLVTTFLSKLVAWQWCAGRSGRYGTELVVRCEMVRQFGETCIFVTRLPGRCIAYSVFEAEPSVRYIRGFECAER